MFTVVEENSQHGLLQHLYEFSSEYTLLFRVVIFHNLCKDPKALENLNIKAEVRYRQVLWSTEII